MESLEFGEHSSKSIQVERLLKFSMGLPFLNLYSTVLLGVSGRGGALLKILGIIFLKIWKQTCKNWNSIE